MARPLKELDDDTLDDYELKMEIAELSGNKEQLKRLKRLVREYLKKRNLTLDDIKYHTIGIYFSNTGKPKTDRMELIYKKQYMRVKRKHDYIIDKVKETCGNETAEIVKDCLVKLNKYNECKRDYKINNSFEDDPFEPDSEWFDIYEVDKAYYDIISHYETEYNRKKDIDRNIKRLYVIKRMNEEREECEIDYTELVNANYDGDLYDCDISEIAYILYTYETEYRERFKNINEKQLYIIDRINGLSKNDYTDIMLSYFNNELIEDKLMLEILNEIIVLCENEYNEKYNKQPKGRPKKTQS